MIMSAVFILVKNSPWWFPWCEACVRPNSRASLWSAVVFGSVACMSKIVFSSEKLSFSVSKRRKFHESSVVLCSDNSPPNIMIGGSSSDFPFANSINPSAPAPTPTPAPRMAASLACFFKNALAPCLGPWMRFGLMARAALLAALPKLLKMFILNSSSESVSDNLIVRGPDRPLGGAR